MNECCVMDPYYYMINPYYTIVPKNSAADKQLKINIGLSTVGTLFLVTSIINTAIHQEKLLYGYPKPGFTNRITNKLVNKGLASIGQIALNSAGRDGRLLAMHYRAHKRYGYIQSP